MRKEKSGNWATDFEDQLVRLAMAADDPRERFQKIVSGRVGRAILEGYADIVTDGKSDSADSMVAIMKTMVIASGAIAQQITIDERHVPTMMRLFGERIAAMANEFASIMEMNDDKEEAA